MTVVVWLVEGTWAGCLDAARERVRGEEPVVLLHVSPDEVAGAAAGAFGALLGRGHPARDPAAEVAVAEEAAGRSLLAAAAERLGRRAGEVRRVQRFGRVEREVVDAAAGAGLLVLARDGDRQRLGPKSLGPATRFVVDHAPCPVLLIWPESAPDPGSLPPPPPEPRDLPHRRRHDPPPH